MSATDIQKVHARRRGGKLLARRGRSWKAEEVAEHLMSCRAQMVQGLRRKSPWAGLDEESLQSCFVHAAALIVRMAADGSKPEWRSADHLEKAQITAFRNQALDHWKRVNAQSRRGDRFTIAFDPEYHAPQHAPLERLFEQPDLATIRRDLLAELADADLRAFWSAVLHGGETFKAAGDGLALTKAQVMARTRAGRSAFEAYLNRRESGELCRDRGADIVAARSLGANELIVERAEAHLESCYACSLVYRPQNGAFERGMLGAAPVGLLLKLMSRAADATSVVTTRWVEAGAAARLTAGGLAATIAAAGSGVAIKSATTDRFPTEPAATAGAAPRRVLTPQTPAPARPALSPRPAAKQRPGSVTRVAATRKRKPRAEPRTKPRAATPTATNAAPSPVRAAPPEFSIERPAPTPPIPSPPRPAPVAPTTDEFSQP